MRTTRFRKTIAWPILLLVVLVNQLSTWIIFLIAFIMGVAVSGPLEWLYLKVAGVHSCGGEWHDWPQEDCKLCHYPPNPNGLCPEDYNEPPEDKENNV